MTDQEPTITDFVNSVELSLYLAQKLERMGRQDDAVWPTFLIPAERQDDRQRALDLVQYVVDRLRARDLTIVVTHRPVDGGQVFMLTLD